MLITFEGIDGCGKSTQLQLLKQRLADHGVQVSSFREPGGTELSESVRSLLLDIKNTMHPVTELLLFSAARSELIASVVQPRLEAGEVVLLDRFYDSTVAYQGYGRQSLAIERIRELNRVAAHGLEPEVTFYFKISIEEAERRRAGTEKDRMEDSGRQFYEEVIRGFDELAESEQRVKLIQAQQSVDQIHEEVWNTVSAKLKNRG